VKREGKIYYLRSTWGWGEVMRSVARFDFISMRAGVRLLGFACGARARACVGGDHVWEIISNILFLYLKSAWGRFVSFYVRTLKSLLHYQPE
jgi:hypothetical protein